MMLCFAIVLLIGLLWYTSDNALDKRIGELEEIIKELREDNIALTPKPKRKYTRKDTSGVN